MRISDIMILLDGKKLSEKILEELKDEIARMNYTPRIGIIMAGENKASEIYVEKKKETAEKLGIDVKIYKYPNGVSTKKLRAQTGIICRVSQIKGVIVQLPLPEHINTQGVLDAVLLEKDVDVLGAAALGKLYVNKLSIQPPAAAGIMKLLEEYKIEIKGKTAVVVGYGRLVGRPVSHLLKTSGATVAIADKNTKDLKELLKNADIIVSGAGVPNLITKDMIKKDAVVIDAGSAEQNGKTVGDIAENVKDVAGYMTPPKGGVGPMTVAMLFYNLVKLAQK